MPHSFFFSANREPSALSAVVARNIRRLRLNRGLTAEELAQLAAIDPLDVNQLEIGKGEPTLSTAWKLANALDVPFAALMAEHAPGGTVITRREKAKTIVSENLGLASRALFPFSEDARVEFYELRLAPDHRELSEPHAIGTREFLHVAEGTLEVAVGREPPSRVNKGDTIQFTADLPHSYRNLAAMPATAYLVMTYR
jgi:transcriptional regulator with XRE-family HTH domain